METLDNIAKSSDSNAEFQYDIHSFVADIREKTILQPRQVIEIICVPKVEPEKKVSSGKKESLKRLLLSQLISESEGKQRK